MSFLRGVFSEPTGQPSASRVMMGLHALIGCAVIGHVAIHTHALPDAVSVAGITAFVTAPYAINQIKNAVSQNPSA